jgi:hypothetical protein
MDNTAASAFVEKRLREWLELFPSLRMRYYFQPFAEVHVIEVKPEWYHDSNETFIEAQLALMDDVETYFPDHGVTYFTNPKFEHLLGNGTIEIIPDSSATATQLSAAS